MFGRTSTPATSGCKNLQSQQQMAEKDKTRHKVSEKEASVLLPEYRTFTVGIYREKKRLVVRKFEEIAGIKVCIDEQYVLNLEDAQVVLNIYFHEIHNFQLN